jgi:hypothetical protein
MKALWAHFDHYNDSTVDVTVAVETKKKYKTRQVRFQLSYDRLPQFLTPQNNAATGSSTPQHHR